MQLSRTILATLIIAFWLAYGVHGGGLSWTNGSMESSPLTFVMAVLSIIIACVWRKPVLPIIPEQHPRFTRRAVAFIFDWWFVICLMMVLIAPIAYVMEWLATGIWQWRWERTEMVFRDLIIGIMLFAAFPMIFGYFWWHASHGKPTIGQFVMGYRVVGAKDGTPRFGTRVWLGLLALWSWPVTLILIFRRRDREERIYYWDAVSNTRAVSTRAP